MLKSGSLVFAALVTALAILMIAHPAAGATIELLSGQKMSGKIVGENDKTVNLSMEMDGAAMTMPLQKSKIHAITDDKGVRRVINAKTPKPVRRPRPTVKKKEPKPEPKPKNDWPCWRGPNYNGISLEKGMKSSWTAANAPKVLWTKQIGAGYSCVSIADGKAYTMGNDGSQDTVWCFDAKTGTEVWKQSYPCGTGGYPGPRATPTVSDGMVFTHSRKGALHAWDAKTGKKLWEKNAANEVGAKRPGWDYASSPFIMGNMLVLNLGKSGAAFNKRTGAVLWKTGGGKSSYATAVPVKIQGRDTLLIFGATGLFGVEAASGKQMFNYAWTTSHDVNCADPIMKGDKVFISTNYGHGCALVKVTASSAVKVYESKSMMNHFNSCVLVGDYLYGPNNAELKCIDFATGSEKWKHRGLSKGSLIVVDGKLVTLSQGGLLAVAEANPSAYKELGQLKILEARCWTAPSYSNGLLYA
ncbi:PQQ-binding-like beta-propeller repeat protein, partial [Planctomycetota bacterium]